MQNEIAPSTVLNVARPPAATTARIKSSTWLRPGIRNMLFMTSLAMHGLYRAEAQPALEWMRQVGTTESEGFSDITSDRDGNLYVTGSSRGSFAGPHAGSDDVIVSKYDGSGAWQWSRQFGSFRSDSGIGIFADDYRNVYVTGRTTGNLVGPNPGASYDGIFAKYDAEGGLQWTRHFGTPELDESVFGVTGDEFGNVYVAGNTYLGDSDNDVFMTKYDAAGNPVWTQHLAVNGHEYGSGVFADGMGNLYLSGGTLNMGAADDAFVAKLDYFGNQQWTRQFGTPEREYSGEVAADELGNVYVSGSTRGDLNGTNIGDVDAYVTKYDAAGEYQWSRQIGTNLAEYAGDIAVDGLGNVYFVGQTTGSFNGGNAGGEDAFFASYDAAGNLRFTKQFGTAADDRTGGIAADSLGNVFVSGSTLGDLSGPSAGSYDAFLAKYSDSMAVEGDTDDDGDVDLEDLNNVRNHFGGAGLGDTNDDGAIDLTDLNNVRNHFGATLGAVPIPEPGGFSLAVFIVASGVTLLLYSRQPVGR